MDLSAAWRLSRLLKQLKPDIVHAHDPHGIAMAGLALSMGTQRPSRRSSRRAASTSTCDNSLSRWKHRQVDCFICASEAIRQMLVADGVPAARTVTVHEGIDLERVGAAPPVNLHEALLLPHQAPLVGNVAALVPHKGQRHLIEAAALVVRKVPDARFVIVGEGELRPALERQIKEHRLEKHVLLPGFRTDVLALHKAFDIFVMSSVTEGLGTSLLDAMAAGKPIVATTTGGIPEVVEDGVTGFLVPPRDDAAMAAAIVKLLKDPETAAAHGTGRPGPGARALQRRANAAGDAEGLPARGAAAACRRRSPSSQLLASYCGTPTTPARQPECARGQSSNVAARPFSENVIPRATRVKLASVVRSLTVPAAVAVCAS